MVLVEMQSRQECSHIDEIKKAIENRNYTEYDFRSIGETTSTLTDEQHKANIRRGIGHCLRGDVFQIVLSRRFVQHYEGDDFKLYRALRSINRLLICSTSTLAVSASSVLPLKPTAR